MHETVDRSTKSVVQFLNHHIQDRLTRCASQVAFGFYELGVREGDKVAIHSENRPEWVFADLGAQTLGSVAVGIYPTSPASEVEYLLNHSEASVLVVEDEEQLDKALEAWDRLEKLKKIQRKKF